MSTEVKTLFNDHYKKFEEPFEPQQTSHVELCDDDVASLQQLGFVEEIDVSKVKSLVHTFTTNDEKKKCRRWIVHPASLNDAVTVPVLPQKYSMQGVDDAINRTTIGSVFLTDFTSWFPHFALPHHARPYFCFPYKGKFYSITTIPTGGSVCPNIGQLASWAIVEKATQYLDPLLVHVEHIHIDNIRVIMKDDIAVFYKNFTAVCKYVNAKFNEKETILLDVRTHKRFEYNFLGVLYMHQNDLKTVSVNLSKKFVTKLEQVQTISSLRDVLRLFGKLVYGSRILAIPTSTYYYCYKFLRRRCESPLDGPADAWPSVTKWWELWFATVLKNERRKVVSPRCSRSVLYTDASLSGFGAVMYDMHGNHYTVAGAWPERMKQLHINILEACAVLAALQLLEPLLEEEIELVIDNTTVQHAIKNTKSRSFTLNFCVQRIQEMKKKFVSCSYIASHLNPADIYSRMFEANSVST